MQPPRGDRQPFITIGKAADDREAAPLQPVLMILTSIPTPYRVHEFSVLSEHLRRERVTLEVQFMASTIPGRSWHLDPSSWPFRWSIARGPVLHPSDRVPVYVAPEVWGRSLARKPRWLVLGGAWYQPPVMALALAAPARSSRLLWVEAVDETETRGRAVEGLKRMVRRRMDGAVVPGLSSARVVRSWSPTDFPVLTLRNFVDERRYGDRVDELRARRAAIRARWDLPEGSLVLLTPARLIHAKGLDMALQAIQGRRGVFLVMAGNGPERQRLEGMIVRMGLTNARLVPSADEPDLLELYAAADALLLPSRRETYGLVAIEALWARLPVLLSSGAGVFEDALEVGTNGWAIDPDCPMSVREAVDHAIETGPDGLREMGQHSRALAEERYRSNEAASTFVQQLLDAFPP